MGTIFHSDNSGVLSLLVGMIALVMFGVLMTLLMDGSLSLSGGKRDPATIVAAQKARIAELNAELELLEARKEEREKHDALAAKVDALRGTLAEESDRVVGVRASLQAEERELERLRNRFSDYRDDYRRELWRSAAGTVLDELTTRLQRTYRGVRIQSISATEMAIDHDRGNGRIPVAELPEHLLEKYHLDVQEAARLDREAAERESERLRRLAEERVEALRAEEEERQRLDAQRRRAGQPTEDDLAMRKEKREEIAALKLEVEAMYDGVLRLNREAGEARARVGGRDRSPPGSLETWEERYNRLSVRAQKARIILRATEDRLRELDPDYRPRPVLPRDAAP